MKAGFGAIIKITTKAGLGLAIWLALCGPALAELQIKPEINYSYYPVAYAPGQTPEELIDRQTPLTNGRGRRISGLTSYLIGYKIDYVGPVKGLCGLKDPQVSCRCDITLPRLTGAGADRGFSAEFAAEVADIRRHELTHCDIAVDHATRLLGRYLAFKNMDCEQGQEAVSREFETALEQCWLDQTAFDHSEYGYQDHLTQESFQKSLGLGYQISPQTGDGSAPVLQDVRPPVFQDPPARKGPAPEPPAMNVPPEADPLSEAAAEERIYKGQDGVWRNY